MKYNTLQLRYIQRRYIQRREKAFDMCPEVRLADPSKAISYIYNVLYYKERPGLQVER